MADGYQYRVFVLFGCSPTAAATAAATDAATRAAAARTATARDKEPAPDYSTYTLNVDDAIYATTFSDSYSAVAAASLNEINTSLQSGWEFHHASPMGVGGQENVIASLVVLRKAN